MFLIIKAAENSFTDAAIAQKSVVANSSSAQNKNYNNSNSNSGGGGLADSSNEYGKELEAFAFDDEDDGDHNNNINNKPNAEGIEESNLNELPTQLSPVKYKRSRSGYGLDGALKKF